MNYTQRKIDLELSLFQAVEEGNINLVTLLIESGVNINARSYDTRQETPIFEAVRESNIKMVENLLSLSYLDNCIDINVQSTMGYTALHIAAYYGDVSITELLCKKGIITTIKDNKGRTAFDIAIEEGNSVTAEIIKKYMPKSNVVTIQYDEPTPGQFTATNTLIKPKNSSRDFIRFELVQTGCFLVSGNPQIYIDLESFDIRNGGIIELYVRKKPNTKERS